jgi:plastocyanin
MNKLTIGMVEILGSVAMLLSAAALVVIPSAIEEEEASAQNANDTNTTTTAAATIQLTATPVNGTYLWIDSNGMYNPTLMLKANTDNTLSVKSIQNDTEEHELIVQSWNNQTYTESEDIKAGSSDEVLFNPRNNSSMNYHCEYHPDTMRGTIQVVNNKS